MSSSEPFLVQIVDDRRIGILVPLLPPVVPRHLPLRPHLGELRLLPSPPPLGADALQQLLGRLHVGVLLPPIGGEVAAEGGREHRLAEALEERGDGVKRLLRAAALGGESFDLGDDTALFSNWRNRDRHDTKLPEIESLLGNFPRIHQESVLHLRSG
ncbi:hypothetical protein SCE1572_49645 [Sorangium cellulosum So0157-2]|uniref:Uncharacterized protein n=1 Tax=Sorangium cellulosum So0157-2 TaxID=1254432 RepID=S4YBY0_SORCE|nr:hypothetical protein SCE1572_49645 [Sorangium cellulosum So0157-2]